MSALLTVRDAHKRFGTTQALAGASFALRSGELLALLGPNGAGKTTLIRAIAGRVRLDQGDVQLFGRAATEANGTARSRLGVVPQEVALYPLLTARENLEAFAALHRVGQAERGERIGWALHWTGLAERAGDLVRGFSGGMKRRLNIACGVLHRPEVVLLDEPTVGVDPQSRERIWQMLGELRSNGTSLLLTTHQLDEAQQVCDRIVIIDHGRAIADGTFPELLAQTIGARRRVTFDLESAPPQSLLAAGFGAANGLRITHSVDDLAVELPRLLAAIQEAGARVRDLHIEAPTLQAVFIHLTGRELRE
jgi:ABC-2 type transport system ATP-binding protein